MTPAGGAARLARAAARSAAKVSGLLLFAIVSLALLSLLACAAAAKLVKDDGGKVCEIVVQAEDPSLAPLCSSFEELQAARATHPPAGVYGALAAAKAKK